MRKESVMTRYIQKLEFNRIKDYQKADWDIPSTAAEFKRSRDTTKRVFAASNWEAYHGSKAEKVTAVESHAVTELRAKQAEMNAHFDAVLKALKEK